jgi:hypothetical protein
MLLTAKAPAEENAHEAEDYVSAPECGEPT